MKRRPRSRGFSLILSLTVMAGMVLLLVTLSAFITIESRAAMNHQLATRARLNALVSMRLALAHLQQEAGPDRRSTARADITQPGVSPGSLRNPMWTGVWRTDLPDLPPAWLVSGRPDQPAGAQMVSLHDPSATPGNPTAKPDYPAGYWAPWQTDNVPTDAALIPLVGRGSASPSEGAKPSGLVSLPKVSLPDHQNEGAYAYWVGDEGIKARINLTDPRSTRFGDVDQLQMLRSAMAPNHGLLPGLENLADAGQMASLESLRHLPMLAGFNEGPDAGNAKRLFHDVTLNSVGLLVDSAHGGLRRDLSLAFELNDRDFAASEFGEGSERAASTHTGDRHDYVRMPVQKSSGNGRTMEASPIFNRSVGPGRNVRGPTWWALRDYHRLYRQLGWTAGGSATTATTIPSLSARTLWPNVATAHPSGPPASSGLDNNSLRNRTYGYPELYDATLIPGIDPNTVDYQLGDTGRMMTRPLAVSATPYLHRLTLGFSVQKMQWRETVRERRGMRWEWVTYEYIEFRLNLTPIVVIHNPYNVQMTWSPPGRASGSATNYAAAVSLSNLKDWKVVLKHYTKGSSTPLVVAKKNLTGFFTAQNAESTDEDTVRFYLRDTDTQRTILLEPGEFRVFSCKPEPRTLWTKSVALNNVYDTRGGFQNKWEETPGYWDEIDWYSLDDIEITNPLSIEIVPPENGGGLSIRHGLACWPGDDLSLNQSVDKFLFTSSEASKIDVAGINRTNHPGAGERLFPDWLSIVDLYPRPFANLDGRQPYPRSDSPPNEGDLITVIDITAKPADFQGARFPLVSHSNPFSPVQLASAGGRYLDGAQTKVRTVTTPSYQMTIRPGSIGWENVITTGNQGRSARGGSSLGPSGSERAIMLEVPLVAPTSLAQYAHANFGVRDQQPMLSIGNSFATPFVPANKAIQTNLAGWTEFDQSYLLNAALWDGYFLSGIGPRMRTAGIGAVDPTPPTVLNSNPASGGGPSPTEANVSLGVPQLVDEIVAGTAQLPNPRLTTLPITLEASEKTSALQNHRKSAKALLNLGAFNVNSTSVEAWTCFLASTKGLQMPGATSLQPGADANARFPRLLSKHPSSPAGGNALDDSNWNGFNNLTDAQIRALAQAIVAENMDRFAVQQRTEHSVNPGPRLFRGLGQAATPYLSLAEFINRFLTPDSWANRCGALQAAILRADQTQSAGINDRLFSGTNILAGGLDLKVDADALRSPQAGQYDFPENIELRTKSNNTNRNHVAMGAPGSLLQSDLLQALGPALATRSDTFTIRCYGEASTAAGDTASAWMEVLVQRLPDFIDPTDPPETGNAAPASSGASVPSVTDASLRPRLEPVNQILGRRFKVISMRWLRFDEI